MGALCSEPQSQEGDNSDNEGIRLYSASFTAKHWPIIYSVEYNISFAGLERIHPFDSAKWGKIYKYLTGLFRMEEFVDHVMLNFNHFSENKMITSSEVVKPLEATNDELRQVHTQEYIDSLRVSRQHP